MKVSADGYADNDVPYLSVVAGQTRDVPAIKLTGSKLSLTGVVVDTTGKPVASAKVFAVDGLKPMETTSAADGAFTLTGFYDAPGFLFAEATDFRLIAVPVQPKDKTPVRVVLRRMSEAPTPMAPSKEHTDADRRLTRHVLEVMYKNHKDGYSTHAIDGMARFDIEIARKWVAEEKERTGGKTDWSGYLGKAELQTTLLRTAKEDVDEAAASCRNCPLRRGTETPFS